MSWAALALILGAAGLYALSQDNQPRCLNCGRYVRRGAKRCKFCYGSL